MRKVLGKPLYEPGDLVVFVGYSQRLFDYVNFSKKWENFLVELTCPIKQKNRTFLVLEGISAKQLFDKEIHSSLTCDDNGYIVVSQYDGGTYFVYENEIEFLE